MIVSNDNAESRLSNPMNLMNRLGEIRSSAASRSQRQNAMNLFGLNGGKQNTAQTTPVKEVEKPALDMSKFDPFNKDTTSQQALVPVPSNPGQVQTPEPPITSEQLLESAEANIKLGLAHDAAITLLTDSITQLRSKLDNVDAEKLPSVINAASKTIESIRRERLEREKKNNGQEVHFHFYTPNQRKLETMEVIDVG